VVACLATIVVPLGMWALLGLVHRWRSAQAWLTPFGSVSHLLSGGRAPQRWAQELVVILIWVVGLNAAGAVRYRRRERAEAKVTTAS
jgi:hypothetical protein